LRPPLTPGRSAAPVRRALVATAALALVTPAAAWAHATLVQARPAFAQRIEASPGSILLRFDQSVVALPNAITVYTSKGHVVSGFVQTNANPRIVTDTVEHIWPGGYTVRWRVTSADSHAVSGVFTFGVRHRAPPATE